MSATPGTRPGQVQEPAGHATGLGTGWFWVALCSTVAGESFLGWYFVTQDLDRADRLASVGAVFLAVTALAGPLLVWLWHHRRRSIPAHLRAPWGAGVVNETGPLAGLPGWPENFSGYRFDREGTASLRLFDGAAIAVIPDFPATMNGCAHQQFFIRWRALGDQTVAAYLVSMPDLITMEPAVLGSSGWMASHGCGLPAFQTTGADASIEDVQVNWQVWVPAA